MYYVYILFSLRDKQLYTGYSPDLRARVKKHNDGYVRATKHRRHIKLIYYEAYEQRLDAKRREVYLKGGKGKNELKTQLRDSLSKLGYKHL